MSRLISVGIAPQTLIDKAAGSPTQGLNYESGPGLIPGERQHPTNGYDESSLPPLLDNAIYEHRSEPHARDRDSQLRKEVGGEEVLSGKFLEGNNEQRAGFPSPGNEQPAQAFCRPDMEQEVGFLSSKDTDSPVSESALKDQYLIFCLGCDFEKSPSDYLGRDVCRQCISTGRCDLPPWSGPTREDSEDPNS